MKITTLVDGWTHNLALPAGVEVDWLPAKIGISKSIKEKFDWLPAKIGVCRSIKEKFNWLIKFNSTYIKLQSKRRELSS